jgi:hypothetical protein
MGVYILSDVQALGGGDKMICRTGISNRALKRCLFAVALQDPSKIMPTRKFLLAF